MLFLLLSGALSASDSASLSLESASLITPTPMATPTAIHTPTFTLSVKDIVNRETIAPKLSIVAVILLTVVGCVVFGVFVLVVGPGLRHDLAPLLE